MFLPYIKTTTALIAVNNLISSNIEAVNMPLNAHDPQSISSAAELVAFAAEATAANALAPGICPRYAFTVAAGDIMISCSITYRVTDGLEITHLVCADNYNIDVSELPILPNSRDVEKCDEALRIIMPRAQSLVSFCNFKIDNKDFVALNSGKDDYIIVAAQCYGPMVPSPADIKVLNTKIDSLTAPQAGGCIALRALSKLSPARATPAQIAFKDVFESACDVSTGTVEEGKLSTLCDTRPTSTDQATSLGIASAQFTIVNEYSSSKALSKSSVAANILECVDGKGYASNSVVVPFKRSRNNAAYTCESISVATTFGNQSTLKNSLTCECARSIIVADKLIVKLGFSFATNKFTVSESTCIEKNKPNKAPPVQGILTNTMSSYNGSTGTCDGAVAELQNALRTTNQLCIA